jgi:hypothetical protein
MSDVYDLSEREHRAHVALCKDVLPYVENILGKVRAELLDTHELLKLKRYLNELIITVNERG